MSTIHQAGKVGYQRKKHMNSLRSLQGCPQRKGIVVKLRIVSPKKPNSAKRKVARVRLTNKFMITARIKGQGHNLQSYSAVLVSGGRANDLPGVRYTMIRGVYDFG
jgi:small subunit ribosomal protein S12